MKYSEARHGRVFILRLEDGEIVHTIIEDFCAEHKIFSASVQILGGADKNSRLVVGPAESRESPPQPMETELDEVYEIHGVGTVFPNEKGIPVLHMHISSGRKKSSITGCVRRGVKVWHVMEAVITEIKDSKACRKLDEATGFELLEP